MRRSARTCLFATTLVVILGALSPVAGRADPLAWQRLEKFGPLLERLQGARDASVSSVCGSGVAPWAYRGQARGKSTALRAYRTDAADRSWATEFVRVLMREADWDSTHKCETSRKPCDQTHRVPLYVVELHARGNVYALLDFEERWAQVFEADRPLGTVRFADRADSLFGLVRAAMRSDSLTRTLSLPPESTERDLAGRIVYDASWLEQLPDVVQREAPKYPDLAREAKVQGLIRLQVLVGEDGNIHDAFVASHEVERGRDPRPRREPAGPEQKGPIDGRGVTALDDAALDAVWRWKFKPAAKGGKPLAVWVSIPVRFTLH
jgi:hypothetical protein